MICLIFSKIIKICQIYTRETKKLGNFVPKNKIKIQPLIIINSLTRYVQKKPFTNSCNWRCKTHVHQNGKLLKIWVSTKHKKTEHFYTI